MAEWQQSDIYPQFSSGSGVYREVVVGKCPDGLYSRHWTGRPYGHKKYYDRGNFGLVETVQDGVYTAQYSKVKESNLAEHNDCFDYAYRIQQLTANQTNTGKLDIGLTGSGNGSGTGSGGNSGGSRGQRSSTDVPLELIAGAIIGIGTIIYWLK